MPLSLRAQRVQVVAPRSGTTLWADLWVVPAGAGGPQGPSPLLPLWFELPLQQARWPLAEGCSHPWCTLCIQSLKCTQLDVGQADRCNAWCSAGPGS